ncbi:UNVERIFIED_CONTAM: hypothetical protein Sindi_2697500 [Sesamum indicum]
MDFQEESAKNKANWDANPAASSIVYHGRSSSVGTHKRKMEVELDRPSKQMELLARCYKKKVDCGWSGPRDYDIPIESEAMTEQQLWLAAVGIKNKDPVFGLSSEAYISSRTYTSPSPPPLTPALPPPPPQSNPAMED